LLLRGTGFRLATRDATEIIFLSWLVNCLVPAKLGDVYRAWLLKINSPVSLSRTVGTVFIERILDLFAIVVLGLGAGFVSFRSGLPSEVQLVFAIGIAFVVVLAAGLLTLRNFGRRILRRLPLPQRILEFYDRFEDGVFSSIGLRALPVLLILTGLIWATEASRLYLVVEALGLPDVHLGISGAFFVPSSARSDRGPAQPRRPGSSARRRRRPCHRVRRPAPGGRARSPHRSGHQRLLDHRLRVDRLRRVEPAPG
jgi:uncharacterized protein (TIRG00374 family)